MFHIFEDNFSYKKSFGVIMTASESEKCLEDGILESDCYKKWNDIYKNKNKYKANPYIAIKDHINEDTVTDLLAYIIANYGLEKKFIAFLINSTQNIDIIEEFETQKSIGSFRIDLFIKFKTKNEPSSYIIFENKIFDAPDQPHQLKNYINAVKKEYNEEKNIHVFYVSSDGSKPPKETPTDIDFHQLGFYRQKKEKGKTIYDFLFENKGNELIRYFCDYLEYMFSYPTSVTFFNSDNTFPSVNELFESTIIPSITERIYEYTSDEELKRYYLQLYKVHILNNYIQSKFKNCILKKEVRYNFVFEGLRIEDTISIENNKQPITLETKYYRNNYFIVLSIYFYDNKKDNIKQYISKLLTDDIKMSYFECDDKKKNYSLWLWIPNELSQVNKKEPRFKKYTDYIDEICNCMTKLFNAFSNKKKVSIDLFVKLFNTYH